MIMDKYSAFMVQPLRNYKPPTMLVWLKKDMSCKARNLLLVKMIDSDYW